jgi:hypothetical protein
MSCGGGASTSSGSPNAEGSPAAPASAATKGNAAAIHLVLTGGPTPGTFDAKSSDSCTFLTEAKLWGARYGDNSVTATLVAFTLAVNITKSPATFTLGVLTANEGSKSYDISTVAPGFGSGTAEVQDLGATAKMSMNGTSKEGYGATVTVQCNKIDRL